MNKHNFLWLYLCALASVHAVWLNWNVWTWRHKFHVWCVKVCTGCCDTLATPIHSPNQKSHIIIKHIVGKQNQFLRWIFNIFILYQFLLVFLYSRTKMLKLTNIRLKARCLFAFSSPCMDFMEYFYTGVESHIYYPSFDTLLLTFWPLVIKWQSYP